MPLKNLSPFSGLKNTWSKKAKECTTFAKIDLSSSEALDGFGPAKFLRHSFHPKSAVFQSRRKNDLQYYKNISTFVFFNALLNSNRSSFQRTLLSEACYEAEKLINLETPAASICSLLTSMGQLKMQEKELLNKISQHLMDKVKSEDHQVSDRELFAFALTCASVNYLPRNSDEMIEVKLLLLKIFWVDNISIRNLSGHSPTNNS